VILRDGARQSASPLNRAYAERASPGVAAKLPRDELVGPLPATDDTDTELFLEPQPLGSGIFVTIDGKRSGHVCMTRMRTHTTHARNAIDYGSHRSGRSIAGLCSYVRITPASWRATSLKLSCLDIKKTKVPHTKLSPAVVLAILRGAHATAQFRLDAWSPLPPRPILPVSSCGHTPIAVATSRSVAQL
jgi:hypothetical protein